MFVRGAMCVVLKCAHCHGFRVGVGGFVGWMGENGGKQWFSGAKYCIMCPTGVTWLGTWIEDRAPFTLGGDVDVCLV